MLSSPKATTTTTSTNQPSPLSYQIAVDQISNQSQSQPIKTTSTSWGISEDIIPKIVELRRLLNRHPEITNPEIIIQGVKHFAMMGDYSFLEEKLAYLRSFDALHSNVDTLRQQQQQTGQENFVV